MVLNINTNLHRIYHIIYIKHGFNLYCFLFINEINLMEQWDLLVIEDCLTSALK